MLALLISLITSCFLFLFAGIGGFAYGMIFVAIAFVVHQNRVNANIRRQQAPYRDLLFQEMIDSTLGF